MPFQKSQGLIGRHAIRIDAAFLKKVEELGALGLPQYVCAKLLGISQDTFIKKRKEIVEFSEAWERGRSKILGKLYEAALKNAFTETAFAPGGSERMQLALIDRIEGRLDAKQQQSQGQAAETRTQEVVFRITEAKPGKDQNVIDD